MARGGKREGAGRPVGSPNKTTSTLRELAREHTEEALATLLTVMGDSDSDAAKVSAAKEILDRGYGKSRTVLSGDEDGNPVELIHKIVLEGVVPSGNSPD